MAPSPRRRHQPSGNSPSLDQETYALSVRSDEPAGLAAVVVRATMSVADLHELIAEYAAFDPELPYTFTVAKPGGHDTFGPGHLDPRSLLGGLGLSDGSEFRYACDEPADEEFEGLAWRLHFTVDEVSQAEPDVSYPDVLEWGINDALIEQVHEGDEDDDEGESELDADLQPLVHMIGEALGQYDQPPGEEAAMPPIDDHVALARRLLELTASRPDQFDAACDELGEDLGAWVFGLFQVLLQLKRLDDAGSLLDLMAGVSHVFAELRGLRAELLAARGETEQARSLIDALLAPGQPAPELRMAESLQPLLALGDLRRVEDLAYQLRKSRELGDQCDALEALVTVYQRTGRKREARKLQIELDKLLDRLDRQEEEARALEAEEIRALRASINEEDSVPVLTPATATSPAGLLKVGRNEPCPCGSGKKFKKCCGL